MKALKLAQIVHDTISGVDGALTHLWIDMAHQKQYIFQPRSLNPENGQPADSILVTEERVTGGEYEEINPSLELLGSDGEDIVTSFKGKIVSLVFHMNGCEHVEIKPPGLNPKNGATHGTHQFDIRMIKGEKIKVMTEPERKEDEKKTPSPSPINSNISR